MLLPVSIRTGTFYLNCLDACYDYESSVAVCIPLLAGQVPFLVQREFSASPF